MSDYSCDINIVMDTATYLLWLLFCVSLCYRVTSASNIDVCVFLVYLFSCFVATLCVNKVVYIIRVDYSNNNARASTG